MALKIDVRTDWGATVAQLIDRAGLLPGFHGTQVPMQSVQHGPAIFLLFNLALAFYLVGCIWAHEIDIFRNWKLLDPDNFRRVQTAHWGKLPYWVFTPLAIALAGSIALIWYHPAGSPAWAIWGNLGCQLVSHLLTAALWGPWQARLSREATGGGSPYLSRILRTHWIRTLLISGYGAILLAWAIAVLPPG